MLETRVNPALVESKSIRFLASLDVLGSDATPSSDARADALYQKYAGIRTTETQQGQSR
jgi:hypothetical protein